MTTSPSTETVTSSRGFDYSPYVTDPTHTSPLELAWRSGSMAVQRMLQAYTNFDYSPAMSDVYVEETPDGAAS